MGSSFIIQASMYMKMHCAWSLAGTKSCVLLRAPERCGSNRENWVVRLQGARTLCYNRRRSPTPEQRIHSLRKLRTQNPQTPRNHRHADNPITIARDIEHRATQGVESLHQVSQWIGAKLCLRM